MPTEPAEVRGLDIGCGANFIYCLLGAAIYGWNMTGEAVGGWLSCDLSYECHMISDRIDSGE